MILGITGQLGAGKDTVYERAVVLAESLGLPPVRRISFADKLKDSACAVLGITRDQMEELKRDDSIELSWGHEDAGMLDDLPMINMRTVLQRYGTEAHRDIFGDNFWVDMSLPRQSFDLASGTDAYADALYCVTDVRFPNEADRVIDLGGFLIRVLNGPLKEASHASEQILSSDLIDYEIQNDIRDDDYKNIDSQLITMFATLGITVAA